MNSLSFRLSERSESTETNKFFPREAKRSPLPIDLEQGEIPTSRERAHFVRDVSGEGSLDAKLKGRNFMNPAT